jgi:hypothetical protein
VKARFEWYPDSSIMAHSFPTPDPTGVHGTSHRQEQLRCYGLGKIIAERCLSIDRERLLLELRCTRSIPNAVAMHIPSFLQYHTTSYPSLMTELKPHPMFAVNKLSVDLVERSRVVEAALPHLVDDLFRMGLVFDLRSSLHGQLGASAYTGL